MKKYKKNTLKTLVISNDEGIFAKIIRSIKLIKDMCFSQS